MNVAENSFPSSPVPAARESFLRRLGRGVGQAAVLLPMGLLALVATLSGRAASALRLLRVRAEPGDPRPGAARLVAHAALTVLLGVVALIPVGMLVLFVARGVLYGFVDDGPYDTSWGGPSRAGAWLAHFAVSCPVAVAATAVLYGLAGLHRRMTAPLRGERRGGWVLPTVWLSCLAGALFLVAFVRQLN
ncbi:hypothetical protein MMF93_10685 [Streptomyces tubbatahanensis]|uniref:Integral membrane protein n=1 Tax=Streptomyces tubbatahanensis TaxID=2923272 RepID=A0ABY3XRF1_9ACTN|nr:hypothetical protein [Streptomyces tubbatahanensis]UNS96924.1 hypothetical protein MMF93_10685 [Streptomyces tubbatahanensis]